MSPLGMCSGIAFFRSFTVEECWRGFLVTSDKGDASAAGNWPAEKPGCRATISSVPLRAFTGSGLWTFRTCKGWGTRGASAMLGPEGRLEGLGEAGGGVRREGAMFGEVGVTYCGLLWGSSIDVRSLTWLPCPGVSSSS